jgi:hypothetical protein
MRATGFQVQTAPLEKAALDFLRKWYMFGWSYRDLFRHIPAAMLPDDHDVYHGNIWGEGGVAAPTDQGWNYPAQDRGGYKMPAAWVNLAQRSQTSHLPDPHDPTPVAQGIGVYYAHWNYAGVSFAILEDRKFKSAPGHVLPQSRVVNGFATNRDFDSRQNRSTGAHLLGERQQRFLEGWALDWSNGTVFKVALSQSPFCAAHTLPAGSTSDDMVPRLPIPRLGEYIQGDEPAADMDTNGWPQDGRNAAVRALRAARALHLSGDQHLATVIRYGIDNFGDAGFVFTAPALNNIWPRRWWPTLASDHQPLPGQPPYTGNFIDAFGNRLTMYAAANPRITGRLPAIITTVRRATDPRLRQGEPRFGLNAGRHRPGNGSGGRRGWPITIHQRERPAIGCGKTEHPVSARMTDTGCFCDKRRDIDAPLTGARSCRLEAPCCAGWHPDIRDARWRRHHSSSLAGAPKNRGLDSGGQTTTSPAAGARSMPARRAAFSHRVGHWRVAR